MNVAPAFALAIALVAFAPASSASCYLPPREDLSALAWASETRAVTNLGDAWGVYELASSNFTPFARSDGLTPVVTSPDGAWAAWIEDAGRDWGCERLEPRLQVRATDGGDATLLARADVRAIAAGPTQLAVAFDGAENITLFRWGEREGTNLSVDRVAAWSRQGVMVDADPWSARDVQHMRFSPDGTLLAIASWSDVEVPYGRREVTVVDVATGIPVGYPSGWAFERALIDLTFDPDSTRLAVMTGEVERFVDIMAREVATSAIVGRFVDTRAGVHLAWGPGGLAVALRDAPLTGGGPANGTLVVLNDTLHEVWRSDTTSEHPRALAWASNDRLAVAMGGRIDLVNVSTEATAPAPARSPLPLPVPIVLAAALVALAITRSGRCRR